MSQILGRHKKVLDLHSEAAGAKKEEGTVDFSELTVTQRPPMEDFKARQQRVKNSGTLEIYTKTTDKIEVLELKLNESITTGSSGPKSSSPRWKKIFG